ncbi:MAG: methionine--tRNA ligase subunit beta [Candidatus Micrarchaeota archaeon]
MVSYADFARLEMRIGRVAAAERVQGSEKLLRMDVDLGTERRQLVAGIGKDYAPEEVVGKKIVVLANLEPKKMMGLESQGMLLAAWDDKGVVLLTVDRDVGEGAKVG